jgi:hypothetical protein
MVAGDFFEIMASATLAGLLASALAAFAVLEDNTRRLTEATVAGVTVGVVTARQDDARLWALSLAALFDLDDNTRRLPKAAAAGATVIGTGDSTVSASWIPLPL